MEWKPSKCWPSGDFELLSFFPLYVYTFLLEVFNIAILPYHYILHVVTWIFCLISKAVT